MLRQVETCEGGGVGRPFVKRFALCYRSVVCLSCLSVLCVTFVLCGQTVGRIKMKLGMEVGLDPGHIVLDGDTAPPPSKGHNLVSRLSVLGSNC